MNQLLACLVLIFGLSSAHANTLVVGNRVYSVQEQEKETCDDPGSPKYRAQMLVLDFAQKNGEATAAAVCKASPQSKLCDPREQKKFGVEQVFTFVRKYPASYSHPGCAGLRTECQKRCDASSLFDNQRCTTDCNQYETWNR